MGRTVRGGGARPDGEPGMFSSGAFGKWGKPMGIQKVKGGWVNKSPKTGKTFGKLSSHAKAVAQQRAIEASKHAK